jgi:D-alanyl-D-alanine carboxypeptidase
MHDVDLAPVADGVVRTRFLRGVPAAVVVVAVLALVAFAPVAAGAPPSAAKLRRGVERVVAAGVPGVIVVVRDGRRTVRVAGGSARFKPRRPMRISDRFRIGSLTKTYVATVVLQLAGEGKLSLDDSIERWLPGMVPNGQNVTLRELLNHHSGLFDFFNDPQHLAPYLAGDFAHEYTPEQLVAIAVAHPPLFPPGARPPLFPANPNDAYSNTNYVLLGLTIEKITGRSIGAELSQRIFEPLKLRDTFFATGQRIPGRHAHGYFFPEPDTPLDTTAVSPTHTWAAGAIVSTANDVARFYRALLSGRLLRPDLLHAMRTVVDHYGLGIFRVPSPCGTRWQHTGEIAGYNSVASNTKNGGRQLVLLATAQSPNNQVGSKKAQRAFDRLFNTAACARG